MTLVASGEVLEYVQADPNNPQEEGATIRVETTGNMAVELIAVDFDDLNNPIFGDVPGTILNSDLGRTLSDILGGRGGRDGVEPVTDPSLPGGNGQTHITDTVTDDFDANIFAPSDSINFTGIASRDAGGNGETYGFNVTDVNYGSILAPDDHRVVQVAQLSNTTGQATVVSNINNATFDDDTVATLSRTLDDIQAVAIDPNTGRTFVVNEENPFAGSSVSVLYEVDRVSGDVDQVGLMNLDPADSFVETAPGSYSDRLVGFSSMDDGRFVSVFDNNLLNNAVFVSPGTGFDTLGVSIPDTMIPDRDINGDLGGNFDIRALTLPPNDSTDEEDRGFAIVFEDGALQLYEIVRAEEGTADTTAFNLIGSLALEVEGGGNGPSITDVFAMDIRVQPGQNNDQVLLYIVGRVVGETALSLFTIDPGQATTGAAGTVTCVRQDVDGDGLGAAFNDRRFTANALAFTPNGGQLFAVIRDDLTTTDDPTDDLDMYVELNIVDSNPATTEPDVTGDATIVNANMGTFIVDMDMFADGGNTRLIAMDDNDPSVSGDRRIIELDESNVGPGGGGTGGTIIGFHAGPGSGNGSVVSEELFGFSAAPNGQYFSIWDDARGEFNNSLMISNGPTTTITTTGNNPNAVTFNPVAFNNGDLAGDFQVIDLAARFGGAQFTLLEQVTDGGTSSTPEDDTFQLMNVFRDATGDVVGPPTILVDFFGSGAILNEGGDILTDIRGIDYATEGTLFFVGTRMGDDGTQELFQLGMGNFVWQVIDNTVLNDGRIINDSVKTVAFDRLTGLLMGVRVQDQGPVEQQGDQLIAIFTGAADGEVNTFNLGRIEPDIFAGPFAGTYTDGTVLMDFNTQNQLIATYDFNGVDPDGTGLVQVIGQPLQNVQAMGFNADGELYIITQNFDGNPLGDFTGLAAVTGEAEGGGGGTEGEEFPPSVTDVAVVKLGTVGDPNDEITGRFNLSDVSVVTTTEIVDGVPTVLEIRDFFSSMEFLNFTTNLGLFGGMSGDIFAIANGAELVRISPPPGLNFGGFNVVNVEFRGEIPDQEVDEDNPEGGVDAIAFSRDAFNNVVLAAIDSILGDVDGSDPVMYNLNPVDIDASAVIATFPTVTLVQGLSSFDALGDGRPLLFGFEPTDFGGFFVGGPGQQIIQGSTVHVRLEDDGVAAVENILGADFHPILLSADDGLLFFIADSNDGNDELWSIDISLGNPTFIQNSLTHRGSLFGPVDPTPASDFDFLSENQSIAFDQTSETEATLYSIYQGTHVRTINIGNPGGIAFSPFFGGPFGNTGAIPRATNITGMDFVNDDPDAAETFFYAVNNDGEDSELFRVRLNYAVGGAHSTYVLGKLSDPDHFNYAPRFPDIPITGEDLSGLTFNPAIINPFTGERGALLGTDVSTDQLVFIDFRPRFPNADMYAMYVTQSDLNSTVTVAVSSPLVLTQAREDLNGDNIVDLDENERLSVDSHFLTVGIQPFGGPAVQLLVNHAQGDPSFIVTAPGGTGGAFLGGRGDGNLIPLIEEFIQQRIGTRPILADDLPDNDAANFSSGLQVTESILDHYQSGGSFVGGMVGNNLDNLQELAVSRDGQQIIAIDTDGTGTLGGGFVSTGDEIGRLNPGSGLSAGGPVGVIDSLFVRIGDLPVTGVQGLDFGDIDFDPLTGVVTETGEDLYAIFAIDDPVPVDRFDEVTGTGVGGPLDPTDTPGDPDGTNLIDFDSTGDVVDLAVTPNNFIFAINVVDQGTADPLDDRFFLQRIFRDPDNLLVTETDAVGVIQDSFGNLITGIGAVDGRIGGIDAMLITGYNLELPLPVDTVGGIALSTTLRALTVTDIGDIVAVNQTAGNDTPTLADDAYELISIQRDADGAVTGTTFITALQSGANLIGINDIDFDPATSEFFFVALDPAISSTDLRLFSVTGGGVLTDHGALDDGGSAVQGAANGIAFEPGTGNLFAVVDNGFDDELMQLDPTNGSVLSRESINIGLRRTLIRGMDFTVTGELKAQDFFNDQERLITINTADPLNSNNASPAGTLSVTQRGFTVDPTTGRGFSFNGDQLLTNPNQLYQLNPALDGAIATRLGDMVFDLDLGPAVDPLALTDPIVALAQDPTGDNTIYVVIDTDGPAIPGGQVLAEIIFDVDLNDPADPFDDRTLAVVSPINTAGLPEGEIRIDLNDDGVGDVDADVSAMDFTVTAGIPQLFAINAGGTPSAQIIAINVADPNNSFEVSGAGTVHPDLRGYASDVNGFFYSINTFEAEDPGREDELWVSRLDIPTFGVLNFNTGLFTRLGAFPQIDGIKAMAFSPFEGATPGLQGLYAVDDQNRLLEVNYLYDPSTPDGVIDGLVVGNEFTVLGTIADFETFDDTLDIVSIDFDKLGNLYAQDAASGKLVDLDYQNPLSIGDPNFLVLAGQLTNTTNGSLRPTVGDISYDFSQNQFLAVDNLFSALRTRGEELGTGDPANTIPAPNQPTPNADDSAVLMRVLGTATDSPEGQKIGSYRWAGPVSGEVNSAGSFDTYYAGWVITGETGGQLEGSPSRPDNFFVAGDIRDFFTPGSVGTQAVSAAPSYMTGFDLQVTGRVGQFYTTAGFLGQVDIENDEVPDNITIEQLFQTEKEGSGGFLAVDNDTFETARRVGSVASNIAGAPHEIHITGSLARTTVAATNDAVDYYAFSLLTGQTITIQLIEGTGDPIDVGLFDPDGRLVASDYDGLFPNAVRLEAFRFTADKPGEWRLAVAFQGDSAFAGPTGDPISNTYDLLVGDPGDIGLGALRTDGAAHFTGGFEGVSVRRGDLGAMRIGGTITDESLVASFVETGNFRALDAGSVGGFTSLVPRGSAGLLRSRGGAANFNSILLGDDLQFVDAINSDMTITLEAGGGLGVIRAANLGTPTGAPPSDIQVGVGSFENPDTAGRGFIDLIDITGTMLAPSISTGFGGNVRYIRVGGDIFDPVTGDTIDQTFSPRDADESLSFTDDSGARFSFFALSDGTVTTDPETEEEVLFPHSLTFRALPIFHPNDLSGTGVALVDITSTGGLLIRSNSNQTGGAFEVGSVVLNGSGRGLVRDSVTGLLAPDPAGVTNLNFIVEGADNDAADPLNVFSLTGGNFTRIQNNTGGELVNLNATSVFSLVTRGSVGLPGTSESNFVHESQGGLVHDPVTGFIGGELRGATVVNNAFPFNQQTNLIQIGTLGHINARRGLGNIVVTGDADAILANSNVEDVFGLFEGINAPIVVNGDLLRIDIGEGILPSGTGNLARSGIFVGGRLERLTNSNQSVGVSDIRGDIVAHTIGSINLVNGSIVNAEVLATDDFSDSIEFGSPLDFSEDEVDTIDRPIFELGEINISRGGIIGTRLAASDFGNINILNGFGLLAAVVSSAPTGVIGNSTVSGLGIRNVSYDAGNQIGDIVATGRGELLDLKDFSPSLRFSENSFFDPFSGQTVNLQTDLYTNLGLDPEFDGSSVEDVTIAGAIDGIDAAATLNIGRVIAFRIQDLIGLGNTLVSGQSIAEIRTLDSIDGLIVKTGRLPIFLPGGDVTNTQIFTSGLVNRVQINGDFGDGSLFVVDGADARVNSFIVNGDMDADLFVFGIVGTVNIGGDLSGSIVIQPNAASTALALTSLTVGGSVFQGALDIDGNVGTINVAGSLGQENNPELQNLVRITGNLNSLIVGSSTDANLDGATLAADVIVEGNLGALTVTGQITGDVTVKGNIGTVKATADSETGRAADPLPERTIGDLFNGVTTDFDITALTVIGTEENGSFYAVHNAGGTMQLLRIDRKVNGDVVDPATPSVTFLGDIMSGLDAVLDIFAIEYDSVSSPLSDRLLLVGTLAGAGPLRLFSVDFTGSATQLGVLSSALIPNFDRTRFSVRGLSLDSRNTQTTTDDTLFAVIHDNTTGPGRPFPTDNLYRVNITTSPGFLTDLGVVKVDSLNADGSANEIDTHVKGMDIVNRNNQRLLIAINDDPAVPGDAFLMTVNTVSPGDSFRLTPIGSADENLRGLTSDGTRMYSINDGTVRAEDSTPINQVWQSDYSVIFGRIAAGGTLGTLDALGGDLDADVNVGLGVTKVNVLNGDLSPDRTVSSALKDIGSVVITGGDLHGRVIATHGTIGLIDVNGSDMSGDVSATNITNFTIDGSMLSGSSLTASRTLTAATLGGDLADGASIEAGSALRVTVGRDLLGDVTVHNPAGLTALSVNNNFGGSAEIAGDLTLFVRRSFGRDIFNTPIDGTRVHVGGDAAVSVGGVFDGELVIDGFGTEITIGNAVNAFISTGFDLMEFTATGPISNSIIQAGLSSGDDGRFNTGDPGERSRMGNIGTFTGTLLSNAIVAAGGSVGAISLTGMTDSTFSSGFSVGNDAMAAAIADATPLADATEQNAARSGADRALFHGDVAEAALGVLSNGVLSAGVDPVNGLFGDGDDAVISPAAVTGGFSTIDEVSASGSGRVIADTAILSPSLAGGVIPAIRNYTDAEVAPGFAAEGLIGFASDGFPVVFTGFNGNIATITVDGPGVVEIRDELGLGPGGSSTDTDNTIDSLFIRGGDDSTQITIHTTTAGGSGPVPPADVINIGRIVTDDDTTAGVVTFDGDITGNGPFDLWIDGGMESLSFRAMPNDGSWSGRVGGDMELLSIHTQGPGTFFVGGHIEEASIVDASGISLLVTLSTLSGFSDSVTLLTTDAAGADFVFDQALGLVPADLVTGTPGGSAVEVRESFDGRLLDLNESEFLASQLLGISELVNQQPTHFVGALSNLGISIASLTVDTRDLDNDGDIEDRVVGIENAGFYGQGNLPDFDNISALTVNNSGQTFLIDQDAGGAFELYRIIRLANGAVDSSELISADLNVGGVSVGNIFAMDTNPGTNVMTFIGTLGVSTSRQLFSVNATTGVVTAGALITSSALPVTDDFSAMAFLPGNNRIHAIRQVGGVDTLVTIAANGVLTTVGAVGINGDTTNVNITGMDFSPASAPNTFRLVAYSDPAGAANAQRLLINRVTPLQSNEYSRAGNDPENGRGLASSGSRYVTALNGPVDTLNGFNDIPDRLVEISPLTGQVSIIGNIIDVSSNLHFNNTTAIAFNDDGELFAYIDDADGAGSAFNRGHGAVFAQLESTDPDNNGVVKATNSDLDQPNNRAAFLDADPTDSESEPITDRLTEMLIDHSDRIFGVRHDAAGQEFLFTHSIQPDETSSAPEFGRIHVTPVGSVTGLMQIDGGNTHVVGLGLTQDSDIVAYNLNTLGSGEIIGINLPGRIVLEQREDDDSFVNANDTLLTTGRLMFTEATIGDEISNTGSRDLDVYRLAAATGDVINVEAFGRGTDYSTFDPEVAIYDAAGNLLAADDDGGQGVNSLLSFTAPADGDYFVVIAGFAGDFPANPFDALPDGGATGDYRLEIGLNASGTGFDPAAFEFITAQGTLSGGVDAYTMGRGFDFHNAFALDNEAQVGGRFFNSPSTTNPLGLSGTPLNLTGSTVAGGGLGGNFNIIDIDVVQTLDRGDRVIALNFNDQGTVDAGDDVFELYEIFRDPVTGAVTGFAELGDILDPALPGPNRVLGLQALTSNSLGDIFVVGTSGVDLSQKLFRVGTFTEDVNNDTIAGEVRGVVVGRLNGGTFLDSVVGLEFNSVNTLFGVQQTAAGPQNLITIATASLPGQSSVAVTNRGQIRVEGLQSNITELAFTNTDVLFSFEAAAGETDPERVVRINTAAPGNSTAVTARGAVNENLLGYAFDPTYEDFLAIYADGLVNDQLWSSPDLQRASTFGRIDTATGDFLQLQALAQDANGTPLNAPVAAAAADNVTTNDVFVFSRDGRLFQYDGATGAFVQQFVFLDADTGQVISTTAVDGETGNAISITSTAFNAAGMMFGVDAVLNQLVQVELDVANGTAVATSAAQPGSVNAQQVVDITFDPAGGNLLALTDNPATFAVFRDSSDDLLGGLFANSIEDLLLNPADSSDPDAEFSGRVVTLGNTIGSVVVNGQFSGNISSDTNIESFTQQTGNFGGVLQAQGDIGKVDILSGNFENDGVVNAGGYLGGLTMKSANSVFGGTLAAGSAGKIAIAGRAADSAQFNIGGTTSSFTVGKQFEGDAEFFDLLKLSIGGTFASTASVQVHGNAGAIALNADTAARSLISVDGKLNTLAVKGVHRGTIGTRFDLTSAKLGPVSGGLLAVGTNAGKIATGAVTNSVLSFGSWIGPDGVYNTEDDVIYGGTAASVAVGGDFSSSVVAAGVLPSMFSDTLANTAGLPSDNRDYIGFQTTTLGAPTLVDAADAGGILRSSINALSIKGQVLGNNQARGSYLAAADSIGTLKGKKLGSLASPNNRRVYGDPVSAPTIDEIVQRNNAQLDVIFSEQLNTDGIILSVDGNNDGDLLDPQDSRGSITLRDQTGAVLDDANIFFTYSTFTDQDDGDVHGVVSLRRVGGFGNRILTANFDAGDDNTFALYDRSGGRSVLRDFDQDGTPAGLETAFYGAEPTVSGEDPFGTLLDGDGNGTEGGSVDYVHFFADAANAFPLVFNQPLINLTMMNGFAQVEAGNNFATPSDVDVFRFKADAFDFFSAQYEGDIAAAVGLFVLDDQGTAATGDDSFELVTRHNDNFLDSLPLIVKPGGDFESVELPPMEAAVGGLNDLYGSGGQAVTRTITQRESDGGFDGVTFTGANATGLVAGERVTAIATIGDDATAPLFDDYDVYSFVATEGQFLAIEVNPFGPSTFDPTITVYDAAGNVIAFPINGNEMRFQVDDGDLTPDETGTFFVVVSGIGGAFNPFDPTTQEVGDSSGAYRLTMGLGDASDGLQTHDLTYFVVTAQYAGGAAFEPNQSNSYQLTFTRAATDDLLDGIADGKLVLPDGERVGYISNSLNAHNNTLGFNAPKQLVFLNFGGGISTDTSAGTVHFDAFDAAQTDPSLGGLTNLLINGGVLGDVRITGIVQNLLAIYRDTPGSQPLGQLNVQLIGADISSFLNASDGLFFTTEDPAKAGLVPSVDYTTLFIGQSDLPPDAGFLGLAETIDANNLDKGDEAIIPTETFAGISGASDLATRLIEYSRAFANVIGHELGHILGLNHTGAGDNSLIPDDVDNDGTTPDVSNLAVALMGSGASAVPGEEVAALWQLGTAPIIFDGQFEFPVGNNDTLHSLLLYLGPTV